jgi:hypothetical protein
LFAGPGKTGSSLNVGSDYCLEVIKVIAILAGTDADDRSLNGLQTDNNNTKAQTNSFIE